MSEQNAEHGTGEDLDPPLEQEVTPDVLSGGSSGGGTSGTGSTSPDAGGSTADEATPGSDGDGAESGYTAPGELAEDPSPAEPTD